jgi:hypothetical protein
MLLTGQTPPTGDVTITGTPQVGQTLSAVDGLSDVNNKGAVSFQWLRDGANISGATQSTYTLVAGDNGKSISVKASYTDGLNKLERVTSAAVNAAYGQTAPAGDVTITGSTSNWSDLKCC